MTDSSPHLLSRNFILSCLAQFSFSSAFFALVPTLPIYLSRMDAKGTEIGLLIGALSVFSVAIRPFVGRSLVRTPERRFMAVGAILFIATSVGYLWAMPFWPLFILRVLQGIGMALFSTASFTLIANISPPVHRGRLFSYYYLSINFAFALSPYVGMLVINRFNFPVLFLVCTGLSVCSLLTTLKLSERSKPPEEERSPEAGRALLSREALPASIMGGLLSVIWGSLGAFFPLDALSHGVSNPGIFFALLAVTLILGRFFGGKILDQPDRKRVVIPCLCIVTLSMLILSVSASLALFIFVAVMLGAGWALLYPSVLLYAIDNPNASRGPAMATFTALSDLGVGLGPMVMGAVLEWTSYPVMFGSLVFVGIVNLLYFQRAIAKRAPVPQAG